jgi:hypothetical protein
MSAVPRRAARGRGRWPGPEGDEPEVVFGTSRGAVRARERTAIGYVAMNEREATCVNALLKHLKRETGTVWSVSVDDLDTRHPARPTPEAIITDGNEDAAVEVKALRGPQDQEDFFGGVRGLSRVLAPETPGHYIIGPPHDMAPFWDRKLIRFLKKEIARVAPTLPPGGEKGYLKIPRRCRVVMANKLGSWVDCYHGRPEHLWPASALVTGNFTLVDEDACASVDSVHGRQAFVDAVVSACHKAANGAANVWAGWSDEWPIWRLARPDSYVEVVAVWGAYWVPSAIDETVWKAIQDGKRKFDGRWATRHILLLDSQFHFTDVDAVKAFLEDVPPTDFAIAFGGIDEIVLYRDEKVWPVLRKPTSVS